jgi:hypothetical protein
MKKLSIFIASFLVLNNTHSFAQNKDSISFNSKIQYGQVSDKEGNNYRTVVLDNKTWMAENLRVTKYKNENL